MCGELFSPVRGAKLKQNKGKIATHIHGNYKKKIKGQTESCTRKSNRKKQRTGISGRNAARDKNKKEKKERKNNSKLN